MRRPLISDQWAREFHSDVQTGIRNGIMITPLTFCGTLEEFYKVIARFWNDATRKKYDRDYNNVILPHINNHNIKIISSYTKEDCDEMLRRIQEDGYDCKGVKCEYSETVMNHFKYLIYSVFSHAANAGYCDRFLWGTKFELNFGRETLAVRSKTQIKRSLSINQESLILSSRLLMDGEKDIIIQYLAESVSTIELIVDNIDDWAFSPRFVDDLLGIIGKAKLQISYSRSRDIENAKRRFKRGGDFEIKFIQKESGYCICWQLGGYRVYGLPERKKVIDDKTYATVMNYYLEKTNR